MNRVCPSCSSSEYITWTLFPDTNTGVVDGRLRMHDIQIKAYIGCEYCSETIEIVGADEIQRILSGQKE